MSRAGLDPGEHNRRLRLARETLDLGGNGTQFARAAGLSIRSAIAWLRRNDTDLHRRLCTQPRGPRANTHQVLVRLLLLKSVEGFHGGRGRLADALGISRAAISFFEKKWAPDGLDAAIADLMPDDGEAAHG